MRHLIVGTLLVVAALAITSITATLLERAAVARRDVEPSPAAAVVESPNAPAAKPRPGEQGRDLIFVSHRAAAKRAD